MNVPPGGYTVINPDGSATVYDKNGNTVRTVKTPWAYDSLGRPQRTWYTTDADGNLVQHVEPETNALYPILADPDDNDKWDALLADTGAQGPPSSPEQAANMQAAQQDLAAEPSYENPDLADMIVPDDSGPSSGAENLPTAPPPDSGAGYPGSMNSMLIEGGREPLPITEPDYDNPELADALTTGIDDNASTQPDRGPSQGAEPAPGQTLGYDDWLNNNLGNQDVGVVNARTGPDGQPEYYHTNPDGTEKLVTNVQTTPNGELIYGFGDGTEIRADEYARYEQAQEYIYQEMKNNRGSLYFDMMRASGGSIETIPIAYGMFLGKVLTDGDWDHKPKLRKMFGIEGIDGDLYFPVPEPGGHREVYYDIYSNIHYGYIGAEAGIPPSMLITAANLGTSATGVNDPGDDIAMNAGIELSQQHGDGLTQAQLNDKITDVINQIDTAQKEGAPTEQVRHR